MGKIFKMANAETDTPIRRDGRRKLQPKMKKTKKKTKTPWRSPRPRDSNDVFDSRPEQVLALRKAMEWSRRELGIYLGLYVSFKDCFSIYRWEKNLARPHLVHRAKMLQLVEMIRDDYLKVLTAPR